MSKLKQLFCSHHCHEENEPCNNFGEALLLTILSPVFEREWEWEFCKGERSEGWVYVSTKGRKSTWQCARCGGFRYGVSGKTFELDIEGEK